MPIPRGQPVEVALTGDIAGALRWSIDGECLFGREGESTTPDRLTLVGDDVRVAFRGETCEAEIVIDSATTGTVDPALGEGGRFSAIQRRVVAFTSTPGPDEPGGAPAPNPEVTPDAGAPSESEEPGPDAGSSAPDGGDAG